MQWSKGERKRQWGKAKVSKRRRLHGKRDRDRKMERKREGATFVLRDLPRYFSIKLLGTPAAPHRHQNFAIGETARRDDAETGFRA